MVEQQTIDLVTIGWKLLDWGVPFVIGILFRKRVGNFLVKLKKLAFNDYVNVNLLAVREYSPSIGKAITPEFFDMLRPKISGMRLVDHNPSSFIISVPEFSTNLILEVDRKHSTTEESRPLQESKIVRFSLKTENPLGIGIRDIGKRITYFEKTTEKIFETLEKFIFLNQTSMKNTYAVCDLDRIGRFVEKQNFDEDNKDLHARVLASGNQISITTSPIDRLAEAAEKYRFI